MYTVWMNIKNAILNYDQLKHMKSMEVFREVHSLVTCGSVNFSVSDTGMITFNPEVGGVASCDDGILRFEGRIHGTGVRVDGVGNLFNCGSGSVTISNLGIDVAVISGDKQDIPPQETYKLTKTCKIHTISMSESSEISNIPARFLSRDSLTLEMSGSSKLTLPTTKLFLLNAKLSGCSSVSGGNTSVDDAEISVNGSALISKFTLADCGSVSTSGSANASLQAVERKHITTKSSGTSKVSVRNLRGQLAPKAKTTKLRSVAGESFVKKLTGWNMPFARK